MDQIRLDVPTQLLIGGEWRDAASGETFAVHDPGTGEVLAQVASAGAADALAALDAACEAQASWAATSPRDRGELLRAAYELITQRADDFARLMTLEMGKPLAEARGEVTYGAEFFRWFAEEAPRVTGRYGSSTDGRSRIIVAKKPVGPCLLITPWNFPLAMGTRKIGPALAAGCTMVLKPAKLTPLTSLLLAQTLLDAGLPPGVVNVIPAASAGEATQGLLRDPRLRKLSFTGSTPVGQELIRASADRVLRTSMELGGNAPLIVFDDADIEVAVAGAMAAKFRNIGQACTAANRILVQSGIAEEFVAALTKEVRALAVGHGLEEGVQIGPLINDEAVDHCDALVRDAVEQGAVVHTGGQRLSRPGSYYPATVLVQPWATARIHREEIFGPVAPVVVFGSEDEAYQRANDGDFGLVGYVFTRDVDRALRAGERLEVGMLGVNTGVVSNPGAPFGGVKMSGIGREGGLEGIEEYLETQYLSIPRTQS